MEEDAPGAKRKKAVTGHEVLAMLKDHENDVAKVANEMLEELCPFDLNDQDALLIEDRIERVAKVSNLLQKRVRRLAKKVKESKFRHNPEGLDETVVSCSQYSLLQSQEVEDEDEIELASEMGDLATNRRPEKYKKKPLDQGMDPKTRQRRVADKRETLSQWAEEEGVTPVKLLGYLLYLETFMKEKKLSKVGWKLFMGDSLEDKPEMSLEEVIWIREKSGMSEAVMQELRLRLLDRYCSICRNIHLWDLNLTNSL